MDHPLAWLAPVLGYLLGSIPFAFLIGRVAGVDLRLVGSGNVGAGNLTRVVGVKAGAAAALLDGFKGLIPILVLKAWDFGPAIVSLSGLAIVIGHNWSIFMRGRSGRGLAPSSGVLLAVAPPLIVWPGGWAVAGWKFGGGLAGFIAWSSLPVVAVLFNWSSAVVLACFGLAMLCLIRRMQGNSGRIPGFRAAIHRAIFDTDGIELAETEEAART